MRGVRAGGGDALKEVKKRQKNRGFWCFSVIIGGFWVSFGAFWCVFGGFWISGRKKWSIGVFWGCFGWFLGSLRGVFGEFFGLVFFDSMACS